MRDEPKISELEKLIEHFRSTGRESELDEVIGAHKQASGVEILPVINDTTHEFSEEAIIVNKIAWHEGVVRKSKKPLRRAIWLFRNKWYIRFGLYWLALFIVVFSFLNAPIFIERVAVGEKSTESKVVTYQELAETPMAESAPIKAGETVPDGSWLKIPKIKVTAPIQFVETTDEATIQAYLTKGLVHYKGTADPGEVGNVFITGHSSNYWWIEGKYNYVFVNLDKLKTGDQAIIYHNGNKHIYEVKSKIVVKPSDVSVLKKTETPILTLMTCTPAGTNWKRLIIKLDQIAPKYTKPQLVTKTYVEPSALPSTDTNSMGAWVKSLWDAIFNN